MDNDDVRPLMLLPPKRVTVDKQRSIVNVRRRVSALVDGTVDRTALARSVLGSRSLLERNGDIGRILDGLSVPFTTAIDGQFRASQHLDRHRTDSRWTSEWKERMPNTGLQKDRFYSYDGAPPLQTSSIPAVVRFDNIADHTAGTGQQDYEAQRITQPSAERSGPATVPSRFRSNEDRQENTNASASPTDIRAENPQAFPGTRNSRETLPAEPDEHVPLGLPDPENRSLTQLHSVPLGLPDSEDRISSQFRSIPEDVSNSKNRGSANLSSIPVDQPDSRDGRSVQTGSIPQSLPDPHDNRSSQLGSVPDGPPDSHHRRSAYSSEGVRRSAETTRVVSLTEKEHVISQIAETSGMSQRSISAHSAREMTPAATVTLHVDTASNTRAPVTQHVHPAASMIPDSHRQGLNLLSMFNISRLLGIHGS